eukprot:IDg7527t1
MGVLQSTERFTAFAAGLTAQSYRHRLSGCSAALSTAREEKIAWEGKRQRQLRNWATE